jgi:hypothetical protein
VRNFDLLDCNGFNIMKSIKVGDLRAEIKMDNFLQMDNFVFDTACTVNARNWRCVR